MALYNETYAIHGMQQDNSPKLPSNEYSFENYNIRFSTEGPNSKIVIKPEMGNSQVIFDLYDDLEYSKSPKPLFELPFIIIGACVVDKYIIVFGKQQGSGKDYIVRLEKASEINGTITFSCVYLFDGSVDLNFSFENPIESHPYVETELQKKVYFCDGRNFIRCINVVNPQCINNLGLLNIGHHLALNETLKVTKKPHVFGSIPGGKLQIAFAYGTDIESMTGIIDYSALYDCVFENAGIDPGADEERAFADHTFEVRIDNLDPSFEWVFIYMIHRTSLDATPVIYVKNIHIETSTVIYTVDLGDSDVYISNKTIEELIGYNSIIPLTIQPYENRMFAGNIKIVNNQLPQFDDNDIKSEFYLKKVGKERIRNHTYNYNPSDNTFVGSSYDNKGFRKGNWYKFGFIGQYEHGEWSDVMSLTTKQCDKHSKTSIDQNDPSDINIENVKFRARFKNANSVYKKLLYLKSIGIKKLKPVCVYPTDSEKTIISQGIVNPTVYRGKNRRSLNGYTPFAQPSWFFRPIKLFSNYIEYYKDRNPYTMRNVNDLKYSKNYLGFKEGVQYPQDEYNLEELTWQIAPGNVTAIQSNPEYTNTQAPYCNWNENFREFRHGMSLPTKDRINAECEFSEISGFDYAYSDKVENSFLNIDEYCLSNKSCLNKTSGNAFLDSTQFDYVKYNYFNRDRVFGDGINKLSVARPSLESHGYDNMIFVDSSICTFNSPEIDYYLIEGLGSSNINIKSPEYSMRLSGLSQINGSLSNIEIAPTTMIDSQQGTDSVQYLSSSDTVQGTCIVDTKLIDVNGVRDFLFKRNSKSSTQSPFCYTSGPFWFDKLLVLGFSGQKNGNVNNKPIKDSKIYSAYPGDQTASSAWLGAFTSTMFQGKYLAGMLLGFDPISLDTTLLVALCFLVGTTFNGHRRVKRAPFESTSQFVQTYYGELCHRSEDEKKDTLIASGKILFGKYDKLNITTSSLGDVTPLIYTESDFANDFNAFGDPYSTSVANYFTNYTTGKTLVERITIFANHGISLESLSDKSYFNLNYLNANTGNYWMNFFLFKTGSFDANWDGGLTGKIKDSHASTIIENNASGGGNLCYFYGWWPRYTQQNDPDYPAYHNSGKYDYWDYPGGNQLTIMTFPYALPSDTPVFPLNYKKRKLTPSIYGSHYYGQFSTDFPTSLFDPYYAHVIYPIMHIDSQIPFCGTSNAYYTNVDSRPIYNYTSSVLYSNVTTYFSEDIKFNTVNNFINEENELITIPYLGDNHSLQKYGTDKTDIIKYNTISLTAATKWYRGWRDVLGDGEDGDLYQISKGWNKDCYEFSIFGNLVFSGYLPQLFTKSGHVSFGDSEYKFCGDTDCYMQVLGLRHGIEGVSQTCSLGYVSSPHIVFCQDDNHFMHTILPAWAPKNGSVVKFNYYYKDFITNSYIRGSFVHNAFEHPSTSNSEFYHDNSATDVRYNRDTLLAQYCIAGARKKYMQWYFTGLSWACANYIYPHTGNWVPITSEITPNAQSNWMTPFDDVVQSNPYWMRKNSINDGPLINTTYYTPSELMDQLTRSYNLCIADYVNTAYEDNSPYEDNVEFYSWFPCGESVQLDDILNEIGAHSYQAGNTADTALDFLEGDTYTTRYNCLKTVLQGNPVDLQIKNGISECASVYIESYINLDGRYNNYEALYNDTDFSYIMNGTVEQVSRINPVYSQKNNLFSYFEKNSNYQMTSVEHFPTMIQWTPTKITGSSYDSFGTFPSSNVFYADGTHGKISKLVIAPSNRVINFQDNGISVLDINPQALLSTEASIIEINASSSTVLNRALYIERTYGCQNKWTVNNAVDGVYFMDNQKKIIGKVGDNAVIHTSAMLGFESWAKDNLSVNNNFWDARCYFAPLQMANKSLDYSGFVSYYDPYYSDLYFINKNICLSLNLPLGSFTSFYPYNNVPYIVNNTDGTYAFIADDSNLPDPKIKGVTRMYRQYYTQDHTFFDNREGYYIDILANPYPLYDKVYNFVSYDNEVYDTLGNFLPMKNGYDKITVHNYHQNGVLNFNRSNTRIKFRTWRTEFPRETGNINRIRGTWCRVRFEQTGSTMLDGTNNLYNLSINFSILEQPKTATTESNDQ